MPEADQNLPDSLPAPDAVPGSEAKGADATEATPSSTAPEAVQSSTESSTVPATEPASSAPFANPPLPPVSGKRGHPLILLLLAVAGTLVVIVIGCNIFDKELPYFLVNLDPLLDQSLRYKPANAITSKDWRNELLVEQNIWVSEVNKIRLGQATAKPDMFKRDYLFYLADSYFRDDPHFMEAKAAYLAGNNEPRVPHTPGYDLSDGELAKKIGYCCLRLGQFTEAEQYLHKAIKIAEQNKNPKLAIESAGAINYCTDLLIECAIRQNHLAEAESLLKERMKRISLTDLNHCVENYLLFNNALLLEKKGDAADAEIFYQKALAQEALDDKNRGVVVGSLNDNNRMLAYILREYSRFLRSQKKVAEAYAMMDRACIIGNNNP